MSSSGAGLRIVRSRIVLSLLAAGLVALLAIIALSRGAPNEYAAVVSIEKSSAYQDPQLLARAWQLPVAAAYRAATYDYQRNQSFCGPASVVNIMHSLRRPQSQSVVLDGSNVWTVFGYVVPAGMTLDEVSELMRLKTGLPVKVLRGLDLAAFRAELPRTNDPAFRYLINFSRGPLFGRGHGHHSPILGYLADEDLVFVGDVNHDYGPWLVKSERLFQAMDTIDDSSGKKRGLLVVDAAGAAPPP
jgi:phytochelatin synthase